MILFDQIRDWLLGRRGIHEFQTQTPEEYYRPGIKLAERLNNGDLSEISPALRPIVEVGLKNGGVRCVEVDAYTGCKYHIIMKNTLSIATEKCLALTVNVDGFTSDYDPHLTLPDLSCFKCQATGETVAFPRYNDWRTRYDRTYPSREPE